MEQLIKLTFYKEKEIYRMSGYLEFHKKLCLEIDCPLRSNRKSEKKSRSSYEQYTTRKYGKLVNFINFTFKKGLARFEHSIDLRLLYSYYLFEHILNYSQAMEQIKNCESELEFQIAPINNFKTEFLKRKIGEKIKEERSAEKDGEKMISLDGEKEEWSKKLDDEIEQASLAYLEFWNVLNNDYPSNKFSFIKI